MRPNVRNTAKLGAQGGSPFAACSVSRIRKIDCEGKAQDILESPEILMLLLPTLLHRDRLAGWNEFP